MRVIFISYRRDDAGYAGRLFGNLAQIFGDDAVFMDVAAIEPGRDFRRAIEQQVAECGVLLALIGKNWLTAQDESGARRLDNPLDFVRLETASALKRDIPVVPVLVDGAGIPRADDLPDDLKELPFRNAVELTHARWDSDVQALVKALRPYVPMTPEPRSPAPMLRVVNSFLPWRRGSPLGTIFVGLIVVLLLVGGWYVSRRKAFNLYGRWSGNPKCILAFRKDDGNTVEGYCNPWDGVRHVVSGRYVAKDHLTMTVLRIDVQKCSTSVAGTINIKSRDTIEAFQDGWNGCHEQTDPGWMRYTRVIGSEADVAP